MEIEIRLDDLRKKSLFVATPMYGGMNHGMYLNACLELQKLMLQYQIKVQFFSIYNESLITRARNYLVDSFLHRSDGSHLLFIDADIHFNPQDVLALLSLDKDVVGAPCPKKSIKWANIKKVIQRNPNIAPAELERFMGDFAFNPVDRNARFTVTEPMEVMELGTGFMMIRRDVFTRFAEAYPHLRYRPDHPGLADFQGDRHIHAYFDTVIDPGSERYLSEDYMFCQWARKIGIRIWVCPWMQTQHVGSFAFKGDIPALAGGIGEI